MTLSASTAAGFDLQSEPRARLVRGRCWGFWDRATAERFQRELLESLRKVERPGRLLLDMTELLPQPDDTQATLRQLMVASAAVGLGQAALVTTNAITRLQLARLVREARVPQWALVADTAQAQQKLGI